MATICGLAVAVFPWVFFSYAVPIPFNEMVVTIDGEKFVVFETDFMDHWFEFYKYKNMFVARSVREFILYSVEKTPDGEYLYNTGEKQLYHLDEMY